MYRALKLKTIIDKEKLFILLLLCSISVLYFSYVPFRASDDSRLYVYNSEASLLSLDFWANETQPFLFPLLLKYLNRDAIVTIVVQVLIFLAVWYIFIIVFLRTIQHKVVRLLSIISLVGFGLSIDIFGWNFVLLSESLHNSMLIFYLTTIFLSYLCDRQQDQWKYSILILLSSFLFCSARDHGMYFVLLVSLGFFLEWIFLFSKKIKNKALLVNAVVGFLVFVTFQTIISYQSRGSFPLAAAFESRILVSPEFRNYFEERGMPLPAEDVFLNSVEFSSAKEVDKLMGSKEFREWIKINGKQEFARFLLSRPIASLSEIFLSTSQLRKIFDEPLGYYIGLHQEENILPMWYLFLERVLLFPRGNIYLVFAIVSGFCFIYLFRRREASAILKLAALMLIGSVMLAFILGHVSATEIQRHTLIVKLMTRLAFFFVILTATDRFLDKRVYGKHLIR